MNSVICAFGGVIVAKHFLSYKFICDEVPNHRKHPKGEGSSSSEPLQQGRFLCEVNNLKWT